ncbi:hypothetical protein LCGC14_1340890 [marine sediment metagenome]|uniref:Uncharacterized protein n=1 Tax=marine sediment metagenome TaxID=412755 RepID=A0A0F9KEH8_9ZZZZ
MPYYAEPVIRRPNHRGKPRLTTMLGSLPGAVGRGFDGDGTPPRRGKEGGHRRLWWFKTALPIPLPIGVVLLPEPAYNAIVETRERTKPFLPPTVPPRIRIEEGLVRAIYIEQLNSGTSGIITPPNAARIILDQWDEEIDAVVSADYGSPTFEAPRDVDDEVVTASFDAGGNWSLSSRPTVYPIHLIYFAETEIGNYVDSSKLLPEA